MNFSGLSRLLVQRWYLTLTGIVITIGLCVLAASAVPAKYQAQADVLLLPPAKVVGPGGNPYLQLGGLEQTTDVVAKALSDSTAANKLLAEGDTGTYTVVRDPTTSSPMLLITGKNVSPAASLTTMNHVVDLANPTLQHLQELQSVPADYLITTKVVAADTKASPVRKNQIRAVVAAGAVGILASVLAIAGLSRLLERRSHRRAQRIDASGALPDPADTAQALRINGYGDHMSDTVALATAARGGRAHARRATQPHDG